MPERPQDREQRPQPSMKVPPKRKGNLPPLTPFIFFLLPSMKVPPKRKGNLCPGPPTGEVASPSMKVPPKRKGNTQPSTLPIKAPIALNESPSEKEGK